MQGTVYWFISEHLCWTLSRNIAVNLWWLIYLMMHSTFFINDFITIWNIFMKEDTVALWWRLITDWLYTRWSCTHWWYRRSKPYTLSKISTILKPLVKYIADIKHKIRYYTLNLPKVWEMIKQLYTCFRREGPVLGSQLVGYGQSTGLHISVSGGWYQVFFGSNQTLDWLVGTLTCLFHPLSGVF